MNRLAAHKSWIALIGTLLLLPLLTAQTVFSPPASIGSIENRFINGDMLLDQRGEGAAYVSPATGYNLDMWRNTLTGSSTYNIQRVSDAPAGFTNSLKVTVTSNAAPGAANNNALQQRIEGAIIPDLNLGLSTAKTITLSFWIKSSLTGTFSVSFFNSAANRSYLGTYTINSASTWEYKTITIIGDTTGTWLTTNGIGLAVWWDLGSGSNSQGAAGAWTGSFLSEVTGTVQVVNNAAATWQITNARLRAGTYDVPYIPRPYPTEVALAQRYYWKTFQAGVAPAQNVGSVVGALCTSTPIALGYPSAYLSLPQTMRTTPGFTTYNPSAANANWRDVTAGADVTVAVDSPGAKGTSGMIIGTTGSVTLAQDYLCIHAVADASL